MFRIFERLKEYLNKQKGENFTQLPSGVRAGLEKYLKPDEEILFTIRNFRAIYKAPRWVDSNTFFNSWFILTSRRIIIAKNSSSFKMFRDIPHNSIGQTGYEKGDLESRLTIHSPRSVDVIEFPREVRAHCEGLEQKVNEALESARKGEERSQTLNIVFCPECGGKILKLGKFCSECGVRL